MSTNPVKKTDDNATAIRKMDQALTGTADTWGSDPAEVLTGVDLVQKAEMVGTPFLITGVKFTHNPSSNIGYVYVEFELSPGGERRMFNDSSTGVRQQLEEFAGAKGWAGAKGTIELEKWYDTRVLCPKGLRVSEYDTKDERGRDTKGRTYYLTTSGGRA